jgi:hypothetical protein
MAGDPVAEIGAALAGAGYTTSNATLDGSPVLVARTTVFRWRWFATRLHTFVVVAQFEPAPDGAELDRFLELASRYGAANKDGLPAGLQTGTAAIAVAVVDHATAASTAWAARVRGRGFASIPYPVLANLETATVEHPGRMVLGAVYGSYLAGIADRLVAPALTVPST